MSFSGVVSKISHNGGLLASFEGKPPRLGANIRISGGKSIGRVQTVLGSVEEPMIHIFPISKSIHAKNTIGSPIEIAPRDRTPKPRYNDDRNRGRNDSDRNRGRNDNDKFNREAKNDNLKPGDWICHKCKNHNYASKKICNRSSCDVKKPYDNNAGSNDRGGNNDRRSGNNDRRSGNNDRRGGNNDRRDDNNQTSDSNVKQGDWFCPKCNNHNYASKEICNRSSCDTRKPRQGKGPKTTSKRPRNSSPRSSWSNNKGRNNNHGRR
ncbi:MAG: zinc finger protein [Candidatus Poseidoniales archaeon]|jgi:rRNA processing protein Gar1/predicted nucleic-acid-binding Zn-ribbon protein|tara:strand:- start:19 stop:813 length:795 start_codon:yes stop_codon:yes gene_type:complete